MPGVRSTVLAIAHELSVDGLVLRYRVDETDDGLRGEEGSFTVCSSWGHGGDRDRRARCSRKLCGRRLAYASPLELYAEEIDPHSGRDLGNFPQAFTHLALINAILHVIHAEQSMRYDALSPELVSELDLSDELTTAQDR